MYPIPCSSPLWKPGVTKEYIGTYLAKNPDVREKFIIAIKVLGYRKGTTIVANRIPGQVYEKVKFPARNDKQSILEASDAILRRLQTSYIDLYQFHCPDRYVPFLGNRQYLPQHERESVPIKETLEALKLLMD